MELLPKNCFRTFSIFFILFFLLLLGCSNLKKQGSASDESDENGVTDTSTPTEETPFPSIFPHLEGWDNPSVHGKWVLQNSASPCFSCHKENATDKSVPKCSSCHPLFPHQSEWKKPENHGQHVLTQGVKNCTTQCHGTDLEGGLSGISCNKCHAIYPHVTDWESPEKHGVLAKGSAKETLCTPCHGEDLKGGESKTSCYTCHPKYPHESAWANAENHGQHVLSNGQANCATQCHGTNLDGGLSGISCNKCHEVYPHAATWEDEHGAFALQYGKTSCQKCHGTDLKTLLNGKNCYSCHDGNYPHPEEAVWVGMHGERVTTTLQGSTTTCEPCHGAAACYTCHPSYPHNKMASAGTLWKDFSQHGSYASANGKTECTQCHGTDFQGGPKNNPSCKNSNCHADYPHTDPNWAAEGQNSVHASTFINRIQEGETEVCQECHGAGYDRDLGGISCATCHTSGVTHQAGWDEGANHGIYFSSRYTSLSNSNCFGCHGDPVRFTDNTASLGGSNPFNLCQDCHDFNGGTVTSSQTRTVLENASFCYRCHWAYPHPGYEVHDTNNALVNTGTWFDPGTPGNHSAGLNTQQGHVYYLLRSPLLMDTTGGRTSYRNISANLTANEQNTCGRSDGFCHSNGNRSANHSLRYNLCSQYCHRP